MGGTYRGQRMAWGVEQFHFRLQAVMRTEGQKKFAVLPRAGRWSAPLRGLYNIAVWGVMIKGAPLQDGDDLHHHGPVDASAVCPGLTM